MSAITQQQPSSLMQTIATTSSLVNINTFDGLKMAVNEQWISEDEAKTFVSALITASTQALQSVSSTPPTTSR